MDRKMRKVMSNIHDDIIDMLMKCDDLDGMKARLRSMLLSINIVLVESKNK